MFIGRREDGTIYGTWTVRQWEEQEEKDDNDKELVEFLNAPQRKPDEPKPASKIIDPRIKE